MSAFGTILPFTTPHSSKKSIQLTNSQKIPISLNNSLLPPREALTVWATDTVAQRKSKKALDAIIRDETEKSLS